MATPDAGADDSRNKQTTHNRSLAGCLRHFIDHNLPPPTDEELDEAIERGFAEDRLETEAAMREDERTERQAAGGP